MEVAIFAIISVIILAWGIVRVSRPMQSDLTPAKPDPRLADAFRISRDLPINRNSNLGELAEWLESLDEYGFNQNKKLNLLTIKIIDYANFISLHADIASEISNDLDDSLYLGYEELMEGYREFRIWIKTSASLSQWIGNPHCMDRSIDCTIKNINRVTRKYSRYKAAKDAWRSPPVGTPYNKVFADMSDNGIPELQSLQRDYIVLMKKLNKPNYMLEAAIEKFASIDFVRAGKDDIGVAIKALQGKVDDLMEDRGFDDDVSLQVIPQMLNYNKSSL